MRTVNLFGAAILALSTSAYSFGAAAQAPAPATPPADTSTPAPDAPAPDAAKPEKKKMKPMHHKMGKGMMGKGKLAPTKAGDKAVEDLNDASLAAAKDNKPFVAPTTPDAAKKEAHVGDKGMMKPMHHKKMMKKAAPKADAAPPATDAAPPADAPK